MRGIRFLGLFSFFSSICLCGCLAGQGPGGFSSVQGPESGDATVSTVSFQHSGSEHFPTIARANSPEWAATSPGSIVCPVPEVVANVRRSNGGDIRSAHLCVDLKVLDASGNFQFLPNASWSYEANYRDPNGGIRELSACGHSSLLSNGIKLGALGSGTGALPSFASDVSEVFSEIPISVRIFAILQEAPHQSGEGAPASCENWVPIGEVFRLRIRYSSEVGDSWTGERDFTMTPENLSFDPFLLQLE